MVRWVMHLSVKNISYSCTLKVNNVTYKIKETNLNSVIKANLCML